jgi:hypothetical protein
MANRVVRSPRIPALHFPKARISCLDNWPAHQATNLVGRRYVVPCTKLHRENLQDLRTRSLPVDQSGYPSHFAVKHDTIARVENDGYWVIGARAGVHIGVDDHFTSGSR